MAENLPEPESRKETFLAKAAGENVELPTPASREELFLKAIADNGGGGGGGTTYTAGDGIVIDDGEIAVDLVQNTGNSTKKVMSQDAVTQALAGAGGGATQLTSADFNYPTENPDGIAIWLLEPGAYLWTANLKTYTSSAPTYTSYYKGTFLEIFEKAGNAFWFNAGDGFYYSMYMGGNGSQYVRNVIIDAQKVKQTIGNSTTDVMSQDATTSMVYADSTLEKVRIGKSASATGNLSVAIGYSSQASQNSSVAIGRNAKTTRDGEVNIGTNIYNNGYNSTPYRVLGGVHDGQLAHDAVTLNQLDGRVKQNAGAPTTSTAGTVGQLLEDTTNGKLYQCTAIDNTDPNNPSYTWTEVGAGGGAPTVVQTTGTSSYDVMSQKAVTDTLFKNNDNTKTQIGYNADASGGTYYPAVAIGQNARATGSSSTAIGALSCNASGSSSVAIGRAEATQAGTVGIGYASSARGTGSIAIGGANGSNDSASAQYNGSIALGAGAITSAVGEMNIGDRSSTYGYNSSAYRLLSGLYDGQSAHDAATVAQGNTLATSAPTTSTVGVLGQLYTDTTNMHTYQCTAISGDTYTWTQRW